MRLSKLLLSVVQTERTERYLTERYLTVGIRELSPNAYIKWMLASTDRALVLRIAHPREGGGRSACVGNTTKH